MSCPTCDHTMTALGCRVTDKPFFVCPRCGTTKTCNGDTINEPVIVVPDLVRRCRAFERELVASNLDFGVREWIRHSLSESINLPADRPTNPVTPKDAPHVSNR